MNAPELPDPLAGIDLDALLAEVAELMEKTPDPLEGVDLDALLAELDAVTDPDRVLRELEEALAPNEGGSSAGRAETPRRKRGK